MRLSSEACATAGVKTPVIGFSPRGWRAGGKTTPPRRGVNAVSLDTQAPAALGQRLQSKVVIQGALDPLLLRAGGPGLERRVAQLLEQWGHDPYVFNLGHGILPDTPIAHVERVVTMVCDWRAG